MGCLSERARFRAQRLGALGDWTPIIGDAESESLSGRQFANLVKSIQPRIPGPRVLRVLQPAHVTGCMIGICPEDR